MKKIFLFTILINISANMTNTMETGRLSPERKQQLQQLLERSAFRKGISVGIQGAMKIAPSDHLPITVNFDDISIVSWNLLTDEFIWNYFRDVGEKPYFAIHKRNGKPLDWRTLFNDFGNFVFDVNEIDQFGIHKIKITDTLLQDFVAYEKNIKRSDNAIKDTESFVNLLLDRTNPSHEDMKTSLMHAIEIKYAITKGYLLWEKRFKNLNENKFLVRSLVQHDFFCFQECTNPQDMLNLLQTNSHKDFAMLSYLAEEGSKDHCVIMYDKNTYMLENHISFGLAQNKKPCIIAKFRSLQTDKPIIIGSIHHSGRGKSEMSLILEQINLLLEGDSNIPVMVLGDYNHQSNFYTKDLTGTGFDLKMPNDPTMAGFEHENLNKAIDGVLTNHPDETTVNVLDQKVFALQITLPIEITFEI